MLSRTAGNLFWLGRYMERAENLARILEVGYRMAQIPHLNNDGADNVWTSSAVAAGCAAELQEKHSEINLDNVLSYLALDSDNPSSIGACLNVARENARGVRATITSEMWEALNSMWLEFNNRWATTLSNENLLGFLEWIKTSATQFKGTIYNSMLRDEANSFISLGIHLERADNTARILDVKFHILLPIGENVGGTMDYYHWSTILRSVSALGAYHYIYRDSIHPWKVAELLILKHELPRSLVHALHMVDHYLDEISENHGDKYNCQRLAGRLYAELDYASIEEIYQNGLHEYLTRFIARNKEVGSAIAEDFHFIL